MVVYVSMCVLLLLLLLSRFSCVRLCVTPQTAAQQTPLSLDPPGKNTGVGCDFRLQCMKVKNESEAVQLCLTLSDPMDHSLPGSSVLGIFQARVLVWGAIAFSDVCASCFNCVQLYQLHGLQPTRLFCPWNSPGKNTGMGSQSFLQGFFPDLGIKP